MKSSLKSLVLKECIELLKLRVRQKVCCSSLAQELGACEALLKREEPRSEVICAGLKYKLQERACDLFFMRRKNIRTFVTSCLQKVRLGLRAWADRGQGNLRGLTLEQIPPTAPCGLSPLKKMGLSVCCRESLSFLAREGIFLPCFLSTGHEGPRGKASVLRSGEKRLTNLRTWLRRGVTKCRDSSLYSLLHSHGLPR